MDNFYQHLRHDFARCVVTSFTVVIPLAIVESDVKHKHNNNQRMEVVNMFRIQKQQIADEFLQMVIVTKNSAKVRRFNNRAILQRAILRCDYDCFSWFDM